MKFILIGLFAIIGMASAMPSKGFQLDEATKIDMSSLLNSNLLSTLTHLSAGTDLATIMNILNLINSVHQLQGDIQSIPNLINYIVDQVGQASSDLVTAIVNAMFGKRDLNSLLNSNLLSTLTHLSAGTDLATIMNILNLINSVHQLQGDIQSIPNLINYIVDQVGQASSDLVTAIVNAMFGRK
jgi:hypothetical protein